MKPNKEKKFLAYLKSNSESEIRKIMLHQTKFGIYAYLYLAEDDCYCTYDSCSEDSLENVMQDWQNDIDERGWIEIFHFNPLRHDELLFQAA